MEGSNELSNDVEEGSLDAAKSKSCKSPTNYEEFFEKDKTGKSALEVAIGKGDEDLVKALLDHRMFSFPRTVLHSAIVHGNHKIVQLLLEHGATLNKSAELYRAIELGNEEIVELFLKHAGEYINVTHNVANRETEGIQHVTTNLLSLAITKGNEKIVEMLLNAGAKMNACKSFTNSLANHWNWERSNSLSKTAKTLMQHAVKLKSLNSHVSDENQKSIFKTDYYYPGFQKECEKEIEKLKSQTFENSLVSYYEFWTTTNLNQLAVYARNENIIRVLTSDDFVSSHPLYAASLHNQLRKGLWRRRMMDLASVFFHQAFTKEKGYENIPKLPMSCSRIIVEMLSNRDLWVLIGVCNSQNGFDVEI